MVEELMKNVKIDEPALMQEPTLLPQEKPTLNHKKVFKLNGTPSSHSSTH
jgi:hypothetical protein